MKITAMSDLHGNLIAIEPCDLLLICGDISPVEIQRDMLAMWRWVYTKLIPWAEYLPCNTVLFTPGNHDFWFQNEYSKNISLGSTFKVLIDELKEFTIFSKYTNGSETVKIYATPWCKNIGNEDPENPRWAFVLPNDKLADKFSEIPFDIDILMTHEAPDIENIGMCTRYGKMTHYGSVQLKTAIESIKPKYALCGHVHTGTHDIIEHNGTKVANVSILNEDYEVHYKPLKIEL